jgi:hypothetical protein
MDKQKFLTTTVSFLEHNLLPGLRESLGRYADFILGGVLMATVPKKFHEFAPMLKGLGLMNDCEEIDVDALATFLTGGFERTPELIISPRELLGFKFENPLVNQLLPGNIRFTRAEADEFINLLKSVSKSIL